MTKQRLQDKLIDFQRDIIRRSQDLQSQEQAFQDREDHLLLELILILDAFENIFKNLEEKEAAFEKSVRRALKSFQGIQRKLLRILEEHGVEKIEFPDGKAVVGLCKVVETRAVEGLEEGQILAMVSNGYQCRDRVLRPAEIITVANRT